MNDNTKANENVTFTTREEIREACQKVKDDNHSLFIISGVAR